MSRPAVFTEFHCAVGCSSPPPPCGGVCQSTIDMEKGYDEVQEPSFIRPHGAVPKRKKALCPASSGPPHHSENCDIVPKPKEAQGRTCLEVCNDLQVAIEVNPGTGWKVMYPEERFHLDTFQPVDVAARLRDDPDICGTCCVDAAALLRAKEAFGHFGPAAVEFIEAEQREVEHERQLREARLQKLKVALLEDDQIRKDFGIETNIIWTVAVILLLVSCWGAMLVLSWDTLGTADLTPGSAVYVVLVICLFWFSACLNWSVLWADKNRVAAEVKLLGREIARSCSHHCFARFSYTMSVLLTASFVFLTVLCCITSPWYALIFGPAWLCWCCLFRFCHVVSHKDEYGVKEVSENTIVFKGKVLDFDPSRGCPPCVCSWPGKYESAWDSLVESSRERGLSAAVVFLPEGSKHFGSHDPIPDEEALEGDCWCIPLYGEKKPWGCKWWTHWVANIEKAVEYGAELNVYFFEKKKGQGKVQSFATAGQEHLRREAIGQRKAQFEESVEFQNAKAAGLEKLSKCRCLDSSSQYTREWQRLFLAWLPEEDRKFLEASEGLGNSQKAEVAWLERKGYAYKEVEVDAAAWTRFEPSSPSPKVTGVATE